MEACCKAREPEGTQLLRDAVRATVGGAATPRGLETGGEGDCAERPRPGATKASSHANANANANANAIAIGPWGGDQIGNLFRNCAINRCYPGTTGGGIVGTHPPITWE